MSSVDQDVIDGPHCTLLPKNLTSLVKILEKRNECTKIF